MFDYCRESGYPSFTAAFESPESNESILAPYMEVLGLANNSEGRAALGEIQACAVASAQSGFEISRLFADYDWRPQIVGACALLMCPEACDAETLKALWDAFDTGSWVSPQLATAAYLRDPAFETSARFRIEAGCPINTDRLAELDWATRHSAAGPASFSAHSSKALASLVAICRLLDGLAQESSWLSLALTNPKILKGLEEDEEGGERIALKWLAAIKHIAAV